VLEKQEGGKSVLYAANFVVLSYYLVHALTQPYLQFAAALSRVKEYDRVQRMAAAAMGAAAVKDDLICPAGGCKMAASQQG
jgi:hypothetical protein